MSEQHARNTARVLNEINPDFVRSRRFVPRKATPLFEDWKKGEFQILSPHEELREIQTMIKHLDITGRVRFDHYMNPAYRMGSGYVWLFKQHYEGYKFPEEKSEVLAIIKNGLGIDESLYKWAKDLVEMPL